MRSDGGSTYSLWDVWVGGDGSWGSLGCVRSRLCAYPVLIMEHYTVMVVMMLGGGGGVWVMMVT